MLEKVAQVKVSSVSQSTTQEIFDYIEQDCFERIEDLLNDEPGILLEGQTLYQLNIAGELVSISPYGYALYLQRFEILNLFMQVFMRESQDASNPLTNILTDALQGGRHIREIEMLVKLGADITFASYQAVIMAISLNRSEALEVFQKHCQDFDLSPVLNEQQTLLHIAVLLGADKVVKYLLENNLDVDAKMMVKNESGAYESFTPLEYGMNNMNNPQIQKIIATPIPSSVFRMIDKSSNYTNCVMQLLEHGANAKSIDIYSNTLIHLLAPQDITVETLRFLIERGVNLNARNHMGKTALHVIVRIPNIELTRTLVLAGADPNILDCTGKLAINSSATREISEFLCQFLDAQTIYTNGKLIPYLDEYSTTLNQLKQIPSLDDADAIEFERIMQLIEEDNFVEVSHIINNNIGLLQYFNYSGFISLLLNRYKLSYEMMKVLLEAKINPNKPFISLEGYQDATPALNELFYNKHILDEDLPRYVDLLLQHGANPCTENPGTSPLYEACRNNRLPILKQYVNHGVDIKKASITGFSVLHAACQGLSYDILKYLKDHGIDDIYSGAAIHIYSDTIEIQTPLDILLRRLPLQKIQVIGWSLKKHRIPTNFYNILKLLELLTDNIFNVNNEGISLIHILATIDSQSENIAELLMLLNQDVCLADTNGDTALHYAAMYNQSDNTQALVKLGIPVDQPNALGMTALQIAVVWGSSGAIRALLNCGADPTLVSNIDLNRLIQDGYGVEYVDAHQPDPLIPILNRPPAHDCLTFMEQNSSLDIEPLIQWQCQRFSKDESLPQNIRAALDSLSVKGFNAQTTLSRVDKYATPSLKLLYKLKDLDSSLGRFIYTHRRLFQISINDHVYKALVKESLFSATIQHAGVMMPKEVAQMICDYLKKEDISAEASTLANMLPGMS